MGVVRIKVPQGIATVTIAGDVPTPEEMERVREHFSADAPSVSADDFRVVDDESVFRKSSTSAFPEKLIEEILLLLVSIHSARHIP